MKVKTIKKRYGLRVVRESPRARSALPENVRVLLVDSDSIWVESYGDLLRSRGMDVRVENGPALVLKAALGFRPDHILVSSGVVKWEDITIELERECESTLCGTQVSVAGIEDSGSSLVVISGKSFPYWSKFQLLQNLVRGVGRYNLFTR